MGRAERGEENRQRNFFDVLGVNAKAGAHFAPDEGRAAAGGDPVRVLSDGFGGGGAVRLDPIGVIRKTIESTTIHSQFIGVAPPGIRGNNC